MAEESGRLIRAQVHRPLAVRQPDPSLAESANSLVHAIRTSLPSVRVQHVGSSAVPGLVGKGVIDVAVEAPVERIPIVTKSLVRMGFQPQSGRDPFPQSRPMLEGSFQQGGPLFSLHCHVLPEGEGEFDELVAFRDALRSDQELRAGYAAEKRAILDAGVTDSVTYAIAKGAFVAQALTGRGIARSGYEYTPAEAVHDTSVVLDGPARAKAARWAIARILSRLDGAPGLLHPNGLSELHGTATATILAEQTNGPALMLAAFPSEEPTPIHDHNTWGVAFVVAGRDRYERWERLDDGVDADRAAIRLAETIELGPGGWVGFDPPPGDIHRQQGIGGSALELVMFGANPTLRPRAYFDPKSGVVTRRAPT